MTRDLPALHRIKQSPGLVRTEVHEAPWAEATLNQIKVPGPRGRVHSRCSRSSIPDAIRDNPATPKAGGCVGCPRLPWSLGSEERSDLERVVISPAVPLAFERHFRCCDESTAAVSRLLACLLYGRYSLGSGAVTDSACTMMPVTRHPPASLIA